MCIKRVAPETTYPTPTPAKPEVQQPLVHISSPWYVVYYHTPPDMQPGFSVMWSDHTTMFFPVAKAVLKFKLFATHPLIMYQTRTHIHVLSIAKDSVLPDTAFNANNIVDFAISADKYLFVRRPSSVSVYEIDIREDDVSITAVCVDDDYWSFTYDKIAVDPTNPRVFFLHGGDSKHAMACTFDNNEIDGRLLDFNSRLMTVIPGTNYVAHLLNTTEQLAVSKIEDMKVVQRKQWHFIAGKSYAYIQCVVTPTDTIVAALAHATSGRAVEMTYISLRTADGTWRMWGAEAPHRNFRALVHGPANVLTGLLVGYTGEDEGDVRVPVRIAHYDMGSRSLFTDPRKMHVDQSYDENVEKFGEVIKFCAL